MKNIIYMSSLMSLQWASDALMSPSFKNLFSLHSVEKYAWLDTEFLLWKNKV